MKKTLTAVLMLFVALSVCFAHPVTEVKESKTYVASTSWVAAIAELAGIDDIVCIAPANLKHPPEYEITAQDMVKVIKADLVMTAGYERMMKTINSAAEVDPAKVIKVKTTNTLENLRNMVSMLCELAGTQEIAAERFGAYSYMIEQSREKIKAEGYDKLTVYANTNQAEFARDLGLNVVATFGAGPLTAEQIADVAKNKYDLVIDNSHNPVASPVSEVSPSSVILVWSNFPDHLGNNALYEVVNKNLEMLFSIKI